jgi:uncharacterized protein
VRTIDAETVIREYYPPGSTTYELLVRHGEQVAAKALAIADRPGFEAVDNGFLFEAALLHDIGIGMTDTPVLGCHGRHPYICHGVLGRELLENHGLHRHALVCERHVGVGLSVRDIENQQLPLPARDMRPKTIEEEIICYADKFFSKNGAQGQPPRTVAEVAALLGRYGRDPVRRFQSWARRFERGNGAPALPGQGG